MQYIKYILKMECIFFLYKKRNLKKKPYMEYVVYVYMLIFKCDLISFKHLWKILKQICVSWKWINIVIANGLLIQTRFQNLYEKNKTKERAFNLKKISEKILC